MDAATIAKSAAILVSRLQQHLHRISESMPQAWRMIDQLRSAPIRNDGSQWPKWCYFPAELGARIVDAHPNYAVRDEERWAVLMHLCTLSAWRATQGIYHFDPTVARALMNTPFSETLPIEILYHIPEWGVYVKTPSHQVHVGGTECGKVLSVEGFFASLNFYSDAPERPGSGLGATLQFALDLNTEQGPLLGGVFPLKIVAGANLESTLLKSYRASSLTEDQIAENLNEGCSIFSHASEQAKILAPYMSLLLYLCSTNADIPGRANYILPRPKCTKKGMRMFPPDKPRIWEVGYRIGAAIRAAEEQEPYRDQGGTHTSPRPHIRRAHWHHFWRGPKAKLGVRTDTQRELVLHWIPPIPVNVGEDAPVIPTFHEVVGQDGAVKI